MIRTLLLACLTFAALALPSSAAAQMTDSARAEQWLGGVCPGKREVLIATTDGERVRGLCAPIETAQLRIERGSREQVVPFAAVDSVWVRQGGAGSGGTTGALIGALAVGGAGVLLGQGLCEGVGDNCLDGSVLLGVTGAAVGGTVGALLGAAGGHVTRTWRRIYPWGDTQSGETPVILRERPPLEPRCRAGLCGATEESPSPRAEPVSGQRPGTLPAERICRPA
ncbi:MAG TPA: hypothetical protein VFT45_01405 [Longimicrobium sp.]|nr:hypothetical protein [Longimicrobium sp.]